MALCPHLPAVAVLFAALSPGTVLAGVPRGLVLAADEQSADETTGTTVAKGHAEVTVERYAIRGRADTIEVRPAIDEILLKGGAVMKVGTKEYASEMLSCTLDFSRCVVVDADQPLPASAFGSAEITPR
ncbi:MAG: hypothetical protein ABL907_10010 [Hyphomicrobium sp.]